MIDIDFSLAMHNLTGKLYLGRDIITALGQRVHSVRYGHLSEIPQNDLQRRVVGRLQNWEIRSRSLPIARNIIPRSRPSRPCLHLDPLTVVNYRMTPEDIVLCHDVGPITHPFLFDKTSSVGYKTAYELIRRVKCHVVCVSQTTRDEFFANFGSEYASLEVIHIPTRKFEVPATAERPEYAPDKFFLTVGALGKRKNQAASIEAFKKSGLFRKGYSYLLTGPFEDDLDFLRGAEATEGVKILGYVSDAELVWLYQNATAFVLMSLLEGFGMPVVEASSYHLPCIVTRGGILEEVGGPSMLTASPENVEEIARQMVAISEMSIEQRRSIADLSVRYAQKFEREAILSKWRQHIDAVTAA